MFKPINAAQLRMSIDEIEPEIWLRYRAALRMRRLRQSG